MLYLCVISLAVDNEGRPQSVRINFLFFLVHVLVVCSIQKMTNIGMLGEEANTPYEH